MKLRWRFGIVAAIFLAIFCLYPQLKMFYLRGSEWNGHYAYNDIDEVAYASYIRGLIDGRPRKNDPYSGKDESPETPQQESLFSIQFAAPYTVAIPARILGVGTPWAMTLSGAFAGFVAALAAFWLIARITGSNWYGMAGSIAVFAGGALAAGEGALPEIAMDGFSYPYFPGFRRYIPAMAMAAVFVLFGVVWKLLERMQPEDAAATTVELPAVEHDSVTHPASGIIYYALLGAAIFFFAYTVFSYFYIWTTAAAWLGCLFAIFLLVRPEGAKHDIRTLVAVGVGCVAALIPYAWLLSKRSETMDHVQLLVYTRKPDLFRVPEYISVVCVVLIALGVTRRIIAFRERSTLFALSLALVPILVFNQQVITGRELQPIHYQVFIGNYVAALALVLTVGILLRSKLKAASAAVRLACAAFALVGILWGFVECHYTVRVLDDANIERDLALPVAKRLEELAKSDPDPYRTTIISFDMIQADDLPSVAPQNVLWARHQHVFPGLTWEENKERYYQMLYYSGIDEVGLEYLLTNDFVAKIALFGWGRHTDRLSSEATPLTYPEISEEVEKYKAYRDNFGVSSATRPLLSYAVINNEADTDLSYLDRWYERDLGEVIGKYSLYRLKLREAPLAADAGQ